MFTIRDATAEVVRQEAVKMYTVQAAAYRREAGRARTKRDEQILSRIAMVYDNEVSFWTDLYLEPPKD